MSAFGEVNKHALMGPVVGKDSLKTLMNLTRRRHGLAKDAKISFCHCTNVRKEAVAQAPAFDQIASQLLIEHDALDCGGYLFGLSRIEQERRVSRDFR